MTTTGPITFQCSASLAASLGASVLTPITAQNISFILIETERGLMFWPLHAAALSQSVGDPANRRRGRFI